MKDAHGEKKEKKKTPMKQTLRQQEHHQWGQHLDYKKVLQKQRLLEGNSVRSSLSVLTSMVRSWVFIM
jgi:hypothetical protein